MNLSWNQNIQLPAFSCRKSGYALMLALAPNILFLLLAWFTNTARPLINLDYFIAALLFSMPWRMSRYLGIAVFLFCTLFDILMFVMQLFPFIDINGAIYLIPFIFNAPWSYQTLFVLAISYIIIMPLGLWKLGIRTNLYHVLWVCIPLAVLSYFTGLFQYHERSLQMNIFGRNNFFYGKSQIELYFANKSFATFTISNAAPNFLPLRFAHASAQLAQPPSSKILFIVNESWGQPKNPALQAAVLEKLAAERERFAYWQEGHFPFVGSTIQGEIRELCALYVDGPAMRHTPPSQFTGCISHKLQQQGYMTIALHGASSLLYDRSNWYPKAGFSQIMAAEQMMGKPTCMAFNGVCDSALFPVVQKAFATHPKLFFYWMTLTTHTDYYAEDLFNHRLKCAAYGLPADTMLCRNFSLQTQFFDELAALVKQPEMRGTEVIVVGDHPPPAINLGEIYKYLTEEGEVAWIHFKVKD